MRLNLVAISPTITLFDYPTSLGEIVDDAVGRTLSDTQRLGNIAQTTEELRNQGYALESVLAEADKLEASDKLSKQDIGIVKKTIDQTFKRDRTALEILQDCRAAKPR